MSFVGPRPELPVYVAKYTAEEQRVLELRPGITDLATLEFQNEEELLSLAVDGLPTRQSADAVERFYIEYCLPRKIELNLAYANRASVWEDTKLILRTVRALVSRQPAQDTTQRPTLRGGPGSVWVRYERWGNPGVDRVGIAAERQSIGAGAWRRPASDGQAGGHRAIAPRELGSGVGASRDGRGGDEPR